MLRINSFGGLSVERDGRPLAGAAAQPRRMAILALLARADERGVTRDRVMSLLWPDMDEERARRALTQALYALRQDLGDDEAIAGVKELRLDLERISTDLHEFRRAKSRDSLDDAAAAYRGPFLDGFHLPGADEFERWADQERRGLAREHAELVERLAFLAEKRGDFSSAVGWWRRLAAIDPLSARVAVSLMRALAASGDAHAAIQHARVHEVLLEQELELPADREVAAFAAQLRSEARRQSAESRASAPNQRVGAELPEGVVAAREPAATAALVSPPPSLGAAADAPTA
ncbi:MAG: AfsR/SARP family transcriptional regulator, partial [Gemmatimonadaceae bacterium]